MMKYPHENVSTRGAWVALSLLLVASGGAMTVKAPMPASAADSPDRVGAIDFLELPADGQTLHDTAPRTRSHRIQRLAQTRTYDVHVVGFAVPGTPSTLTSDKASTMVKAVDQIYDAATFGDIRLKFVKFYDGGTLPALVCSVSAVSSGSAESSGMPADKATGQIVASDGAAGYLRISVTPRQDCGGVAGSAWLSGVDSWINGHFSTDSPQARQVVAHEIGHNLGLQHSATLECDTDGALTNESATCVALPYGDTSEIMGNNSNAVRFSSTHLEYLGVLSQDDVHDLFPREAPRTYSVALPPLYSPSGTAGRRTLTVAEAAIEYRPAIGPDSYLSTRDGEGHGVQIRIPGGQYPNSWGTDSALVSPLKTLSWIGVRWEVSYRPHSLAQGQSIALPSGAVLSVTSVDNAAATVSVTVPADTQAPEPPELTAEWVDQGKDVPARMPVDIWMSAWDDSLIERAVLKDNGRTIHNFTLGNDRPDPAGIDESFSLSLRSDTDHVLTAEVTDGAGQTATSDPVDLSGFRWGDHPQPLTVRVTSQEPLMGWPVKVYPISRSRVQLAVPRRVVIDTRGGAAPCKVPTMFFGGEEVAPTPKLGSRNYTGDFALGDDIDVSVRCGGVTAGHRLPSKMGTSRLINTKRLTRQEVVLGANDVRKWSPRTGPSEIGWRAPRRGRAFIVTNGPWTMSTARKRISCPTPREAPQLCSIPVRKGQPYTAASRGTGFIIGSWVE